MGLQKLILNFVLTIEAFFLQILKIKNNRITFISLESDVLTSDSKLIYDMLDKKKYDDWRHGRVPYLEAVCTVNLQCCQK